MSMLTAAWTMTSPFLGLVPRGGPVCAATGLAAYRLHCTATGQLHQGLEAILRRCWWGAESAPPHPLRAERQSHSVVHSAQPTHRRSARSCTLAVRVVVVPPPVRRRLRVADRRVLPRLLVSECGDVEVAPGAAQLLVAAVLHEVGAEIRSPSRRKALVRCPASGTGPVAAAPGAHRAALKNRI